MAEGLQKLADETKTIVYQYRLDDFTVTHSFQCLCIGDILCGKVILEVLGAFIPKCSQ